MFFGKGDILEVISFGEKLNSPIVLCLGFFDCMHLGHISLLNCAKKAAAAHGAKTALFTFTNNHFTVLGKNTRLIYTFDERLNLYSRSGVDVVIAAKFDKNFMSLSGCEFLQKLPTCNIAEIVCGEDYTCGCDLLSSKEIQKSLAEVVNVTIVPTLHDGNKKVSSSLVRQLLSEHKVEAANTYLSEPFFFEGTVEQGRHVGRKLGFPTANLPISPEKLAPIGVYSGICTVGNVNYKAVVNVGNMPTFGVESPCVEAHLLHFDGDLYGKKIKVSLLKYIRPVKKFRKAEQLVLQLRQDSEVADD